MTNAVLRDQGFQDNFIYFWFFALPLPLPSSPFPCFGVEEIDVWISSVAPFLRDLLLEKKESKGKNTHRNSEDTPFLGQETLKHCVGWFFQIQKDPEGSFDFSLVSFLSWGEEGCKDLMVVLMGSSIR